MEGEIRSVRVRRYPIFGEVLSVRWQSKHGLKNWLEAEERLGSDASISSYLVQAYQDVHVDVSKKPPGWELSNFSREIRLQPWGEEEDLKGKPNTWVMASLKPIQEEWLCMKAIAGHLLESELPGS